MRFIIQSALIFALLWFAPDFGDLEKQTKTIIITLSAIFGSLFLTFAVDLLTAPEKIDQDQVNEIKLLRKAIKSANDENRAMAELSDLWVRGNRMSDDSPERDMWVSEVEAHLKDHFRANVSFKMMQAKIQGYEAIMELLSNLASSSPGLDYLGDVQTLRWQPEAWKYQSKQYSQNTATQYFPGEDR